MFQAKEKQLIRLQLKLQRQQNAIQEIEALKVKLVRCTCGPHISSHLLSVQPPPPTPHSHLPGHVASNMPSDMHAVHMCVDSG